LEYGERKGFVRSQESLEEAIPSYLGRSDEIVVFEATGEISPVGFLILEPRRRINENLRRILFFRIMFVLRYMLDFLQNRLPVRCEYCHRQYSLEHLLVMKQFTAGCMKEMDEIASRTFGNATGREENAEHEENNVSPCKIGSVFTRDQKG
jgi:hypothetical protein